ncbi:putative acyltransferase [Pseudomonas asplenii]|uniref:Putative acyltransferase n=1 Tax=Pseudomonas asplenii TaxID=53407 RepID=A0A0M9GGN9_9PSED|nr:acyltransferase [Pseudomonas fuscovaginae]KPA90567.1 putative acyltransferase [Pseudomonas fuscovaginae]
MERLYSLQGLRGAAVVGVVLFHMAAVELKYSGGDTLLPALVDFFQLGVDLFFVISGFVMVIVTRGRFQDKAQFQRFLFNRVSRIYPNYWLYFFITLAVYLASPTLVNSSHGGSNLLMSFLLLPNERVLLVMVAWSLVFELWFYLVFSGLLAFRERWLPALLLAWALALLVFNLLGSWQAHGPALKIILHPYALEFIVGSALALFFYGPHSARVPTPAVWLLFAASLLLGFPLIYHYQLFQQEGLLRMLSVGLVFGALTLSLVLLERRQLIRIPTPLVFTGDMSYTIYLSHLLVLGVVGRTWLVIGNWPGSLLDNLLFLLLMLAAVLCYGWVGYSFFEKPVLDRATRYCNRRFRRASSRKPSDSLPESR